MCSRMANRKKTMEYSTNENTAELEVRDFGPIVKAKIDLRPLTVFVGPSNSGKSYLSILIYALHRYYNSLGGFCGETIDRSTFDYLDLKKRNVLNNDLGKILTETYSNFNRQIELKKGTLVLPAQISALIKNRFEKNADSVVGEIKRCFGVSDTDDLNRRGAKNQARINFRWTNSCNSDSFEQFLTLAKKINFETVLPNEIKLSNDFDEDYELEQNRFQSSLYLYSNQELPKDDVEYRQIENQRLLRRLIATILPHIVGPWCHSAFYLPADRTGMMHARNMIISALISKASTAGIRSTGGMSSLSGVLSDYLVQLINLKENPDKRHPSENCLGEMIEKRILRGAIKIIRTAPLGYPDFVYRPTEWNKDLELVNASSMVAELAPLVLYLRHLVEPNNVLIVEEPESHLHPAMQVELIQQLTALVNKGIKVIVTTHSHWLLEELANIALRFDAPKTNRKNKVSLSVKQIGVWQFEPKLRPKGSIVKEIRLSEPGLYCSDYNKVSYSLHNDWADLSSHPQANS